MATSPIDRAERQEQALRRTVVRLLYGLEQAPSPIMLPGDPEWRRLFEALRRDAERHFRPALARAYAEALREVSERVSRAAITAYAQEQAPLAAAAFAESLEGDTAAAFGEALARAGFQIPLPPQRLLGPTARQVVRIGEWAESARARGLTEAAIREGAERQTRAATRLRARASADRAIADAINSARADAWQAQIDAGRLPANMKKKWRSQGDDRVRPTHRAQARAAAVPWDEPYPIMGVMHPPSDDPGCRCYEEPVVRGRERGKAQPRVPPPRTLRAA